MRTYSFSKSIKSSIGLMLATSAMVLGPLLGVFIPVANAGSLTALSDTMSRIKINTLSSHVLKFTTETGAADNTDTIIITFPSDFNFTSKTIGTVSFTHGATTGLENTETLAASPSATAWGAVFSGTQNRILTLTAPTDGVGAAAVAANDKVIITYDSTNSTNPTTIGQYVISYSGTFGDTGSDTVVIITDDQVVVTATVNSTLTFSISTNTCALGTLSTATVSTCSYDLTSGTNATSGAVITIDAVSDGTNANLNKDGQPAVFINDIGEATVTLGVEGYGIALAAGSGWTEAGLFSSDDSSVPDTLTNILTVSGPVASAASTVTHRAAISSLTEAGTYTQTVQYIATGTF